MITILVPKSVQDQIPLLSLYDGSALETLSAMGLWVRDVDGTLDCHGTQEACGLLEELVAEYTDEKLSWFPSAK